MVPGQKKLDNQQNQTTNQPTTTAFLIVFLLPSPGSFGKTSSKVPRSRGLKPNYGSLVGNEDAAAARRDQWAHLALRQHSFSREFPVQQVVERPVPKSLRKSVGGSRFVINLLLSIEFRFSEMAFEVSDELSSVKTPVKIHQDCNVFATEMSPNVASKALSIGKDRQAYLLCMEGSCKIAGQDMQRHDSAEIKGPLELELLSGSAGAYVLVFEMALTRDSRRGR